MLLSLKELCHVVMVKSAIKKIRRKSQREAARVKRQTDAVLTMEEDEEILFKRPKIVPDTPQASRENTPDPDDHLEEPKDYTAVLQMVKTVQDQLTALVLDNTNIRAACDDLRRQCHNQGVAFGDLSRLVSQTREDREEARAYSHGETGPHPSYPAGVVGRWGQPPGTGYRDLVAGRQDLSAWCPDNGTEGRQGGHRRRQHHTRRVQKSWRTPVADRRCRHRTNRTTNIRRVACRRLDFHVRCA